MLDISCMMALEDKYTPPIHYASHSPPLLTIIKASIYGGKGPSNGTHPLCWEDGMVQLLRGPRSGKASSRMLSSILKE